MTKIFVVFRPSVVLLCANANARSGFISICDCDVILMNALEALFASVV